MKKLTQLDKDEIRKAVQNAERRTSGEFVTVIARQSDSYFSTPVMWAALVALIVPVALIFVFSFSDAKLVLDIQLAVFLILYAVFQIEAVKMKLVPKSLKKNRVQKLAYQQFLLTGTGSTRDHSGVLFFVSLAERSVEIIADKGINDKVDKDEWQKIVNTFIKDVKNNEYRHGFITAIEQCGNLLSAHFPIQPGDKNELADKLIEL